MLRSGGRWPERLQGANPLASTLRLRPARHAQNRHTKVSEIMDILASNGQIRFEGTLPPRLFSQ